MDYISRALVADALTEWRALLRARATVSPLRDLASAHAATIDLKQAERSGLATLFAGRPTLLSALVPERATYVGAALRGRRILEHAESVMAATGTWTAALVVGTVTWEGKEQPLLLRPVSLERDREDDLVITLRHRVTMNPVFAAHMRERGGPADLAERAQSTLAGREFDPRPIWNEVRAFGELVGGLELTEALILGSFDDPEQQLLDDLDLLDAVIGASDVIAALAGDADAATILGEPLARAQGGDRDPFAERGLGDLDDDAFAILDVVAMGRSLAVLTPPGADAVALTAAIVADAAASGRTALVVGGDELALGSVESALAAAGAGDVALSGIGPAWHADARSRLLASLTLDAPAVDEQALREIGDRLKAARADAAARIEALHRPRRPWAASAHEAIQAIVRLTTSHPTPVIAQRLGPVAAASVAEHGLAHVIAAVVARLHGTDIEVPSLVASRPAPQPEEDKPWWHRAVATPEEGRRLDEALAAVVRSLPGLRSDAQAAHLAVGLDEAESLRGWGDQVRLFLDVQRTLDTCVPAVYHRSLGDLVAATAPKGADVDVDLTRSARRALARRATELLRPGRSTKVLHESLTAARDEAERWRELASAGGWPVVPDDFTSYASRLGRVEDAWGALATALPLVTGVDDAAALPWSELASLLSGLAEAIPGGIEKAPVTPAAIDLDAAGFAEVVSALAERNATPSQIAADVEFAWWASAFDAMAAAEPSLVEPGALASSVDAFLASDAEFATLRVGPLMAAVSEHRRRAIVRHPEHARDLFATLMEGSEASVRELRRDFSAVVEALRPVVITRADRVAQILPPTRCVDLVVMVGAESLAMAELVPALARGAQVVVLADPVSTHRSAIAALLGLLPALRLPALPQRRDPVVGLALAELGYGRAVPVVVPPGSPEAQRTVSVVMVDGEGGDTGYDGAVETTAREAAVAAERALVLAASGADVAVIAGSDAHAASVTRFVTERDQSLASRVRVVTLGTSERLTADHVVFTLGFARDARGALPERLGVLTTADGIAALAHALGATRRGLALVTTLGPEQLVAIEDAAGRAEGLDARAVAALRRFMQGVTRDPLATERATPGAGDWLLADVARLLRAQGLTARLRYGVPGQTIPLAVGEHGALTVAVITDEPPAGPARSLRDLWRTPLRRLAAVGWDVRPLWTVDAFIDPVGTAAAIAAAVRGEVATEPAVDEPVVPEEAFIEEALIEEPFIEETLSAEPITEEPMRPEPEPEPEPVPAPPPAEKGTDALIPTAEESWQPRRVPVRGAGRPLIPTRAWEDEDAAWGDKGSTRDDELRRDKPPHW